MHERNSRTKARRLISPNGLRLRIQASDALCERIRQFRDQIADVIHGEGKRKIVIVGPCSVHDPASTLRYLDALLPTLRSLTNILPVVRLAGEKPRTGLGWAGFIKSPRLIEPDEGHLADGLAAYRTLLLEASKRDIPIATEVLDPDLFAYFDELISLAWIGARTVTTPSLRYAASGFSMPVLFKNNINGSIEDAGHAVSVAREGGHTFASVDDDGIQSEFITSGNEDTAIMLRGGTVPNYDRDSIMKAYELTKVGVFVDASHANSGKDHTKQGGVARSVMESAKAGLPVAGVMLESFHKAGAQKIPFTEGQTVDPERSITDACIDLSETIALLHELDTLLETVPKQQLVAKV